MEPKKHTARPHTTTSATRLAISLDSNGYDKTCLLIMHLLLRSNHLPVTMGTLRELTWHGALQTTKHILNYLAGSMSFKFSTCLFVNNHPGLVVEAFQS